MENSGNIIVAPDYDIVSATSDRLKEELLSIISNGSKAITVDMEKISIVDSTGLSVLISTHNSLKKEGNSLELKNVSDNIKKLLAITRLDKHFVILDSN